MLQQITQIILTFVQPITVIGFIVAGICCLLLRQWNYGIINVLLGTVNFFIFFGGRFLK